MSAIYSPDELVDILHQLRETHRENGSCTAWEVRFLRSIATKIERHKPLTNDQAEKFLEIYSNRVIGGERVEDTLDRFERWPTAGQRRR